VVRHSPAGQRCQDIDGWGRRPRSMNAAPPILAELQLSAAGQADSIVITVKLFRRRRSMRRSHIVRASGIVVKSSQVERKQSRRPYQKVLPLVLLLLPASPALTQRPGSSLGARPPSTRLRSRLHWGQTSRMVAIGKANLFPRNSTVEPQSPPSLSWSKYVAQPNILPYPMICRYTH
jgi:hypothetical protein